LNGIKDAMRKSTRHSSKKTRGARQRSRTCTVWGLCV